MTRNFEQDISESEDKASARVKYLPKESAVKPRCFMAPLGLDIRKIVKPVLGKKGFGAFDVLSSWEEIVGAQTAAYTRPSKLAFPQGKRTGGVLHIMTKGGAFALQLAHNKTAIIDKVNTFFGYLAVTDIKISQTLSDIPLSSHTDAPLPKVPLPKDTQNIINSCDDEELRKSLQKLGETIASSSYKG